MNPQAALMIPSHHLPFSPIHPWLWVALLCLFLSATVQGQEDATARLEPEPLTLISPGKTATLSLYLTTTEKITAGKITLSIGATTPMDMPVIMEVRGGSASLHAVGTGCGGCYPDANGHLATVHTEFPGRSSALTFGFLLPSGGTVSGETGGITGEKREIAKLSLYLHSDVASGTEYRVFLKEVDLSNADSRKVAATVMTGKIVVGEPKLSLLPGATTAYSDPVVEGNYLVPTGPEFPGEDGTAGQRRYLFNVLAENLGDTRLTWSVTAQYVDGSPAPESLWGTVTRNNANGTQAAYIPAEDTMRMPKGLRLSISATSEKDATQSVTFSVFMPPYGDANLDSIVTQADVDLAFRWANGIELPSRPAGSLGHQLLGYIAAPLRRLLTDVRGVPGTNLPQTTLELWTHEFERLGQELPQSGAHDRTGFPFGDGRISLADAQWISQKARLNAQSPPQTLDPRIHGIPPQEF